jgi:hypothetical protein
VISSVKKRFLIGLAPLVVVGAFLVIPAASQALPHVYKNGVIAAEGKKLRTLQWGVFKLANTTTGTLECHAAFEGFLENPAGGGSAKGPIQAFSPYECSNPTCTVSGGLFVELTTEHLPWNVEIIEPSAGVFRHQMGVKGEKGGKGSVEFFYNCEGVIKEHVFGATAPLALNNGLAIGAAPAEIEFNAAAGELESAVGAFRLEGKFRQQGFNAEELIEVKNP